MQPSLAAARRQFPQHEKSRDCCSALSDRPDERLNVKDGSFAPLSEGPVLAAQSGRSRFILASETESRSAARFEQFGHIDLAVGIQSWRLTGKEF
jgi:hypothetical protein